MGSPVDEKCSKETGVSLIEPTEFRLQRIMHKKPSELFPIDPEKSKPYMYLITTFCNGSLEMDSNSSQRLTVVEHNAVVTSYRGRSSKWV